MGRCQLFAVQSICITFFIYIHIQYIVIVDFAAIYICASYIHTFTLACSTYIYIDTHILYWIYFDFEFLHIQWQMARTCWWYYISKFTEFFDTLFFILRKKNEHVSTLHVIHHGCMPFSVWMGMKFTPGKIPLLIASPVRLKWNTFIYELRNFIVFNKNKLKTLTLNSLTPLTLGGHSTFFALLNSFVHIVMYFYYMIAAMGPKYKKFIWWKRYLTTFQMVRK